ncbi:MAG: tetratricopeptide repeat protein [Wenzhouxiangella sp.]
MTQIKPVLGSLLLLMATGCSLTPEVEQPDAKVSEETAASYTEEAWSEELLFHLRAAEQAGGGDEHHAAIERLLAAAREQSDLDLIRQAAGMAWRTNAWPALVEATELWLESEPDSADARRLRILGLLNAGRDEAAIEAMQDWLAEAPGGGEGLLRRDLVQVLAAAEATALAPDRLGALFEAAGLDPDAGPALAARSRLYWELGQPAPALELALAAAQATGQRDDLTWAAHLASAGEDHQTALALYRRAREAAPGQWTLAVAEAQTLRQLDRLDEALDVLAGLADNPDVIYNRASYLFEAGRAEEALAAWQQLADWTPVEDMNQHAFMVAWLAEYLELEDHAADWYARVRSGPQVDRAMIRRAVLLANQGRLGEARALLELARDTEQADLRENAYLVEAELLSEDEQPDEALDLLSTALRERPNSIGLLYARAIVAVAIDNLELAEQDLRRIIRIDGDNAMALNALGYTLTDRTSRHNEAYRLIRRALELAPEEPAILDSMGWVYYRLGRPDAALPYLERALAGEDNPEIAAHLVEVLWQLDQVERAQQLLSETRRRHPDAPYLIELIDRLEIDR